MEVMQEAVEILKMDPTNLKKVSLRIFLEKEIKSVEADIFKIVARHGIKSVLEMDEKLKAGEIKEEDILDDFIELDHLETRREELFRVIGKTK